MWEPVLSGSFGGGIYRGHNVSSQPNPLFRELGCTHCTLLGGRYREEAEVGKGLRPGYHDREHDELNVVFSDSDKGSPIPQFCCAPR